eukprot:14429558-Ditylum_brightwellii.AAC.1
MGQTFLCPGIHAVPPATKSSAEHASNTKEATPKGIPPKKPLRSLLRHTGFWRGRALAVIAHRQGKCNM